MTLELIPQYLSLVLVFEDGNTEKKKSISNFIWIIDVASSSWLNVSAGKI